MNIYESISAAMTEIKAVEKLKKNIQGSGFMYRGIDDVMNALQPILAKNKIFVCPQVLEQTREERKSSKGNNLLYSILKIKFVFFAEDGTNVEVVTLGEAMDSGDKASNKAMSIAFKYALFQIFCIPTEEMQDPDGESHNVQLKEYKCTDCNKPFEPFKDKNGKQFSAEQVYHLSEKSNKDHKARCKDCRIKFEKSSEASE